MTDIIDDRLEPTCEDPSQDSTEYCYFGDLSVDQYSSIHGGKWYYAHDKPGTPWHDRVDNTKGWTFDFTLRVIAVENSEGLTETVKPDGLGVYVNDGTAMEVLYFFTQEIVFENADVKILYDTTALTDYRLLGKGNGLQLFAKSNTEVQYKLIADVPFKETASVEDNSSKAAQVVDTNGDIHAVWQNDGGGLSKIYYAKYTNSTWSDPELLLSDEFNSLNPDLTVDSRGFLYLVYESRRGEQSTVGFMYKNLIGWSSPEFLGGAADWAVNPSIAVDSNDNVHIVWEDDRLLHPEIFYARRLRQTGTWDSVYADPYTGGFGEHEAVHRATQTDLGAFRPSITTYHQRVYISYTEKLSDDTSTISLMEYSQTTESWSGPVDVINGEYAARRADHSDILSHVSGNIFVVWQDDTTGVEEIYSATLYSSMLFMNAAIQLTDAGTIAYRHPKLSMHSTNGNLYVVWYGESLTAEIGAVINDDTLLSSGNSAIYLASYDYLNNDWRSSNQGEYDTIFTTVKDRRAMSPAVPNSFTGSLHILYDAIESESGGDGYLPQTEFYSEIYDGIYDLSEVETFAFVDEEYVERDIQISGQGLRKEIRFGDFSNVLSCNFIFENINYYLGDAVNPLEVLAISPKQFGFDEMRVFDSVVNNYGDAWLATTKGLIFFYNSDNTIYRPSNLTSEIIRGVAFSSDNVIFCVALGRKIYYSTDHATFVELTGHALTDNDDGEITSIAFDDQNRMILGMEKGIRIFNIIVTNEFDNVLSITGSKETISEVEGEYVTCVESDVNNVIWIGTKNGLVRLFKSNTLRFTTNQGLQSNYINGIALRSPSIRYIATRSGIARMVGSSIDSMDSSNVDILSNNVKAVSWTDPDILWASTLSYVNQIKVDDFDGNHTVVRYGPSDYSLESDAFDDQRTFFINVEGSAFENVSIPENAVVEIYLNGNKIDFGYELSRSQKVLRFLMDLQSSDIIDVVIRNDVKIYTSLSQNRAAVASQGAKTIEVHEMKVIDGDLYTLVTGSDNEVKIIDPYIDLPHQEVIMDTTPPQGQMLATILGGTLVNVSISEIDEYTPLDNLSGVNQMILSNFSNFTSDGYTTLSAIDFSINITHDLGITSGTQSTLWTPDGSRNLDRLRLIKDTSLVNKLWLGSSGPAEVYQSDVNISSFTFVQQLESSITSYVDFVIDLNGLVVVGVGFDSSNAKVYVSNSAQTSFVAAGTVNGYRIQGVTKLDGKLYIGTGKATDGKGRIYSFDGSSLTVLLEDVGDTVYSLCNDGIALYAATGDNGRLYHIDLANLTALIIHTDADTALLSTEVVSLDGNRFLFAGNSDSGNIVRTPVEGFTISTSFNTTDAQVTVLRVFNGDLYAVVGAVVYKLESGAWVWQFTHSVNINDIAVTSDDTLYVASDSSLSVKIAESLNRRIYLKLIDRAGNESDTIFYDVSISDLQDLVNENQLIEIDSTGTTVFNISGESDFYSGIRVDEERGEYISEIFNGTNEIIKWDTLTYQATIPTNTAIKFYARSSVSRTDILTQNWQSITFESSNSTDISHFSGQFFQFRVDMTSEQRDISPSLSQVVVRSVTGESVHFFSSNFTLGSKIRKGILTSEELVPIAADIVFGINTTDSVDFSDYQIIDTNRVFDSIGVGENMRVGIKLLTPTRGLLSESDISEYGPYSTDVFENTVDFDYTNSGATAIFDFRVTLYEDVDLSREVATLFTSEDSDGFSIDGAAFPSGGKKIASGSSISVLFTVPFTANILCNTFYFIKIESYNSISFETISDSKTFIYACNPSFVDNLDFDFTNITGSAKTYNFRVRTYSDPERTTLVQTYYSGNNTTGWFVDSVQLAEGGIIVSSGETVAVNFTPDTSDLEANRLYFFIIDVFDGSQFVLASNSYTFQFLDISSEIYCGPYSDVPVVKNFGVMFELENSEHLTLNQ